MLVQVLAALPIVAALMTVGYQVAVRAITVQTRTAQQLEADARISNLVQWLGRDATGSAGAVIERREEELVLVLTRADPQSGAEGGERDACAGDAIQYRIADGQATRTWVTLESPRRATPAGRKLAAADGRGVSRATADGASGGQEAPVDGTRVRAWALGSTQVDFAIEEIDSDATARSLVWILFTTFVIEETGPPVTRRLSAAVTLDTPSGKSRGTVGCGGG